MDNIVFDADNRELLDSLFEEITEAEVEELGIDIESSSFAITNDSQANFFLRRLDEIRNEKDKINNTCNTEIEKFCQRVNDFRARELKTLENTEDFFTTLLESYARHQLMDSNKKSLKLPFGTLSFKKSQPKYVYDDEIVMNFIKDNNLSEFIRTKEEINKKDLKSALNISEDGIITLNGKAMEGITITPGEEKFNVK
jgi:phage host-nuclease inhibitor protein Gam